MVNTGAGGANQAEEARASQFFEQGLQQYNNAQYEQAIASYRNAYTIYAQVVNIERQATVLNVLGVAQDAIKNYSDAVASYQEALKLFSKILDGAGYAKVANNLGYSYYLQGNYYSALESFYSALSYQWWNDPNGLQITLINLSGIANACLDSISQEGGQISSYYNFNPDNLSDVIETRPAFANHIIP